MREILFRGKRADNGEWVEGDFCHPCNIINETLGYDEVLNQENVPICNDYAVIPETVGQFTGLRDCKRTEQYPEGQMIFEGDILEYTNSDDELCYITVVFCDCAFLIEDNGIVEVDLLTSYVALGLKVVGNIHDNPELLGCEQE